MQKILLTGYGGFIGSSLIKELNRHYQFVGLDNFTTFSNYDIKRKRESYLLTEKPALKQVQFFEADICNESELEDIFQSHKFEMAIHLAALTGVRPSLVDPGAYIDVNVKGFVNILEQAKKNGIKHIIYASSSSVYGLNDEVPYTEEQQTDRPISAYAASKKANELLAHTYSYLYGMNIVGLRFFTVYGPWTRPDMAAYIFMKSILESKPIPLFNGGDMVRDFTYIGDVVTTIKLLIEKMNQESVYSHRVFNVGNHSPILTKDFLLAIEEAMKKKAIVVDKPIQPGDMLATNASTRALFNYIGFKPDTSIKDGVRQMVEWFTNYRRL